MYFTAVLLFCISLDTVCITSTANSTRDLLCFFDLTYCSIQFSSVIRGEIEASRSVLLGVLVLSA